MGGAETQVDAVTQDDPGQRASRGCQASPDAKDLTGDRERRGATAARARRVPWASPAIRAGRAKKATGDEVNRAWPGSKACRDSQVSRVSLGYKVKPGDQAAEATPGYEATRGHRAWRATQVKWGHRVGRARMGDPGWRGSEVRRERKD